MRSRGGGSGVHGELTHRYRELLIARICHMKERSLPALPAPFTGQTLEVARLSMPVFLPRSRTSRQSFSRAVDGKVAGQDVMPYTSSPAPCPCPPAFPSPRAGGLSLPSVPQRPCPIRGLACPVLSAMLRWTARLAPSDERPVTGRVGPQVGLVPRGLIFCCYFLCLKIPFSIYSCLVWNKTICCSEVRAADFLTACHPSVW